jgi:hypothetical protein
MPDYTTLQNTPITIGLDGAVKTRGWTLNGNTATHVSYNAGYLDYNTVLQVNKPYSITIQVVSLSSGIIRVDLGNVSSANITAAGFYQITLTSTSGGGLHIYSDANCVIQIFTIKLIDPITTLKQRNTVLFDERNDGGRWTTFLTYNPDIGVSLFSNTYSFKNGDMYVHVNQNPTRNNFYGNSYQSILKFPSNINKGVTKTFNSLAYEGNQLLVTTTSGVTTSLGQISELIDLDFLKDILIDSASQINIYDVEGVYSSSFLRDKNVDLINGDDLKGVYIIVELTTNSTNALILKNVQVNSSNSKIGVR